ncbi:MAG: hypothetical protein K0U72_01740 [Gammaproteobacteria bacterium]|nr:hypothetical protein [Gammaproteobacteria bacterium]
MRRYYILLLVFIVGLTLTVGCVQVSATEESVVIEGAAQVASSRNAAKHRPVVDLSRLARYTDADVAAEDPVAYSQIDFPAMSAGESYRDPATGVTVWKTTDRELPSGAPTTGLVNSYPTMGLQISPCWGDPCRNYTLWIIAPAGGESYFYDFELGVGPSNYRAAPTGESRGAFSRTEPGIFYYSTGTRLNRYDTATDSLANTGDFPYSWETDSLPWFHCNAADSHCIGMTDGSASITVIDMSDGTVYVQGFTRMNEPYIAGSSAKAFAGAASPLECWDPIDSTVLPFVAPFSSRPFHTHGYDDFILQVDVDTGGGRTGLAKINFDTCEAEYPSSGMRLQSATSSTAVLDAGEPWVDDEINLLEICITAGLGAGQCENLADYDALSQTASLKGSWSTTPDKTSTYELRSFVRGYPNDIHMSMHWTDASNTAPYSLWTNNRGGAFTPDSWNTAIFFVNTFDGSKLHVGHTYNRYNSQIFKGSGAYWDEGHCTISPDGILIQCGVNGNGNERYDVALWELPWL